MSPREKQSKQVDHVPEGLSTRTGPRGQTRLGNMPCPFA